MQEVKKLRRDAFSSENIDVTTELDYVESLKAEFDMEIHSKEFGFNRTIYIESSTCEYCDKDKNDANNEGNARIDFKSHFQMTLIIMQLLHLNI